ncbi:MAG: adenylate/guanylate cyclase domain-containing protein [Pirellulaceae bacterium]|jgi:adenylate cyclase|nr:adenylate/guanylate cyclase domain-containing protein [Pirellulaceae bacterium]HJN13651.1 adenylate/guanylate cyclase domain-containing protein [Pirellulaceae bacterium]
MPYLIAQGATSSQRWKRRLDIGRRVLLGRAEDGWQVAWDDRISSRHAELEFESGHLHVTKTGKAKNPVFFQGEATDSFSIVPGEHFVIGATSFSLVEEQVDVTIDTPPPVTEQIFSRDFLKQVEYEHAAEWLETLSRLPQIISRANDDDELCAQLVNVLLTSIRQASSVALVSVIRQADGDGPIAIRHWDSRDVASGRFAPSERLIRAAVSRQESVVHIWAGTDRAADSSFTQSDETDWAYCTPISGLGCEGWVIYIAGRRPAGCATDAVVTQPNDLQDDVKFTELVANTLGSLRALRQLERQKASLSQFISPVVLDTVANSDPEQSLAPRPCDVTVLFCDLRGFALKSEQSSENLLGLLQRVSTALGVMTRHILQQGGVIGDFHGDAAMGFWGWPLPQEDRVARACRAALQIRREFAAAATDEDHSLHDFRAGIGIASGTAVAGKIGTVDQVKVTVFGPVVNLASRLEGMTKLLRAPILIDEATATAARNQLTSETARVRRVARVIPLGIETPLEVSELLPPQAEYTDLSDQDIATYEAALDALQGEDWEKAFSLLHQVPADDRVKDFLTVFIAQNNRLPPKNWDGVIRMTVK